MKLLRLLLLGLSGIVASAADVSPVIAPAKRDESLRQARAMLAPRDAAAPQGLKDPFNSEAFLAAANAAGAPVAPAAGPAPGGATPAGTPAVRPAGPRSGRDLLAAIAEGLRPSGSFTLRGEPILTFGARRVKVGDALTVTFEGTEYAVVISAIKPPNFTFRLNNEEFTRPIK
jgi:hypothetical protein